MCQWVKYLLCKFKDMGSNPQHLHQKLSTATCLEAQGWGSRDWCIAGIHSRISEIACLQKYGREQLKMLACVITCTHLRVHSIHTNTHIPHIHACTSAYMCIPSYIKMAQAAVSNLTPAFAPQHPKSPASPSGPGWYLHLLRAQQGQTAILSDVPESACEQVLLPWPLKNVWRMDVLSRMWEKWDLEPCV